MTQALMMQPATARLGLRRVAAWLVDWAVMLGWIGVLTVLGLLLDTPSWALSQPAWDVLIAVATVVPITLWLAWWESRGATPGKRVLRLGVRSLDGHPPGLGRALLRNTLKVAVPWQLGHLVAARFITAPADAAVPASTLVMSVAVYALMAVYLAGVFLGPGRPLYDVLAATEVVRADEG